jgi:hypothetical protein
MASLVIGAMLKPEECIFIFYSIFNEDDVWIKAAASSIGWKACGWHIAGTVFGSRRRQNTSHQPIDAGRMHENKACDTYKVADGGALLDSVGTQTAIQGSSVEPRAMHKGGCFEWGTIGYHWSFCQAQQGILSEETTSYL